jgi:hypothetical protein
MNATTDQKNPSNSFDPAQYASRVPRDVDPPRAPAPDETRTYRPLATSITDTTLDASQVVVVADEPIEPQTTEEPDVEQHGVLRTIGRVATAAGAAAFVALLFVIIIPSLRQQHAATSSSEAIDLLKSAMSKSEAAARRGEPPSLPDLHSILASSSSAEAAAPVSHEESETLLKQFMQWQQKPADAQETGDSKTDSRNDANSDAKN